MKKLINVTMTFIGLWLCATSAQAQSWKDILKSETVQKVVSSVTGGQSVTVASLQGTWTYVDPAVQLGSDNTLKQIAGSAATTELEKKLKEQCAKVGIVEGVFNYTFHEDSTFTSALKKGSLKGTYSVNEADKTIAFTYTAGTSDRAIYTLTASTVLAGDNLTLLFNADKLLTFLTKVASLTSNSTFQSLSQLAEQYDGLMLGFDLKK
ncbi:MAG: DUF4923 family protein [Parabacteroides sp.]|nr:DUF4923 family protein [Parabacteroides sp.]MDD6079163.1 DUF4923 family protein [bacterium]MCI7007761.1 DUF4923 family protein [Parabacteroides sp.]MCI7782303.1 DUF4923 family protein [Parabacteroides sp.]MDD7061382.1 DUF4923 family protein [bacterium]